MALLNAGAEVDRQDKNQWTPLMWAMTNRHKDIAKMLLDHGASSTIKSSSGRTAFDFAAPNSEISDFLHQNGYGIGDVGVDDFYDSGFSQDRFEQEMEESEMKRRMMMESSMNLEVDLSSLGMDERPEVSRRISSANDGPKATTVTRGNRRATRLRMGQVFERPDVCLPRKRVGANIGHHYHHDDASTIAIAKASAGEHSIPCREIRPLSWEP